MVVDEEAAAIIRLIFDKYVNEGFGAQRLCRYLTELGIFKPDGKHFLNTSINRIIKNSIYVGIIHKGESCSGVIPDLQIIDQDPYDRAQRLMFYVRLVKQYNGGLSSDVQQRIVAIAQDYQNYGITAPAGYCEMWAEQVYRAAGVQVNNWCCAGRNRVTNVVSTDSSNIPVGAMVYNDPAVYNSRTTCGCGLNAGHVGIYIGNGMIISNIGGSSTDTLESWTSY